MNDEIINYYRDIEKNIIDILYLYINSNKYNIHYRHLLKIYNYRLCECILKEDKYIKSLCNEIKKDSNIKDKLKDSINEILNDINCDNWLMNKTIEYYNCEYFNIINKSKIYNEYEKVMKNILKLLLRIITYEINEINYIIYFI